MSWFINKRLISEMEWKKEIDKLKSGRLMKDKKEIKELLKRELIHSIEKSLPKERFGILFSGGVDSTSIAFICKKLKKDFICYSVGLENSQDLEAAKIVAKTLNLKLKYKQLTLKEAEAIIKKTARILGKKLANVVNVGVGSVLVASFELAKRDKIKFMFSGLGSEEIFAGYQRHELSEDINKECLRGLRNMWKRDLLRDMTIAKKYKINLVTPFLDKELIKLALQIPSEYKIKDNIKKYILRETAVDLGVKKEFAFRKKLAAQYGSNFDKAIQKLTKKYNFSYKKDFLASLS